VALDAAISIGAESAFGTAAATTQGYEGQADSWKTSREFVESKGFRKGMQTVRADRRRIVDMGGEGELECDVLDAGFESLLVACFDAVTSTPGAEGEPTETLAVTATQPTGPSFTAQMVRPKVDGGTVAYKHTGCAVTEWEFSQEVEEALKVTASFDFQTVTHLGPELPIEYPDEAVAYDWTRGAVYLTLPGGSEQLVGVNSWSLKGARGLKTDRRQVRGNELKQAQKRAELPAYEGELVVEFDSATLPLYEAFIAGAIVGLRIAYTGVTESAAGTASSLEFACPVLSRRPDRDDAAVRCARPGHRRDRRRHVHRACRGVS
jgi:hypothetical protein